MQHRFFSGIYPQKYNEQMQCTPAHDCISSGESIPGELLLSRAHFRFDSFAKFEGLNYIYKLLKKTATFQYSFLLQKLENGQVTTDILKRFYLLMENYNRSESTINKILFKPSFFASQIGLFCIAGLSILFFIAIGLHILYQVKSLPITLFFGFSLIMQLIFKRKSDINIYKKLDKSNFI